MHAQGMNGVMWAVLSEWDSINTKVKALVSGGLSVTNWKTFMSCNCVERGKEYFRLGECGLRGMSGELKES